MEGNETQANPSAETTDYASFLGTTPDLDVDDAAETNPEPAAAPEDEQVAEEVAEQADESSETDNDWLPTEQEKEFPLETLAKYAKRFGYTLEEVKADPRLQLALKDKINSDIYIAKKAQEEAEAADEPTVEEPAATAPDPTQAQQQYRQHIDGLVRQYVNPEVAKQIGLDLLEGFGVDTQSKDPEVQALVAKAGSVGARLATSAVDLNMTVLPAMMSNLVEQVFPGFSQMYDRALYANAYENVRSSDAAFATLPEYGSKEFQTAMREAAKQLPGFDSMVFTKTARDAQGRTVQTPLPAYEQAQQKYAILAKLASGQKVNPAVVSKAVEAGKQLERKSQTKVTRGRALGAGQSNQQFTDTTDETDSILNAYSRRSGSVWSK